jgi:osmotically-inducible protein OsmY
MEYSRGVLTLHGRVPTSALSSALESLLASVEGVGGIDNQVDVISPTGLSSVHVK